ncbi:Hypp8240 [Branchiostoma lanceolatum]|uniref:Hypp8240 protein n=1 Tax=Branchiostoma lanceolatum TaxID=7740 RepID=A0A8J9Z816_BRALA|nr:Hypp8240 [Branchiostoma lanceolatum]
MEVSLEQRRWRSGRRMAARGPVRNGRSRQGLAGLDKCKHVQAGILQHDGAARDSEKSHIADALRNRERLKPREHKRPAFLSSEDKEVFTAYCRGSKALNTCDTDSLDERNLRRAAEILDKRYMSSESSGGQVRNPPRFSVRRFPWESKSLRKLKDFDRCTRRRLLVPIGSALTIKSRWEEDLDNSFDSGNNLNGSSSTDDNS